jgi:hypothetical protein
LAQGATDGPDPDGARAGFRELVQQAAVLSGTAAR